MVNCKINLRSQTAAQCVFGETTISQMINNCSIYIRVQNSAHFALQRSVNVENTYLFFKIQTTLTSTHGIIKNINQDINILTLEYEIFIYKDQGFTGALCATFTYGTVKISNSNIIGSIYSNEQNGNLIGYALKQLQIQYQNFSYCIGGNTKMICGFGDCSFQITNEQFPRCECPQYLKNYNKCACPDGFRDTGISCLQCQAGSILNAENQCDCNNGLQYDGNSCIQCSYYKNIYNGVCSCPPNHLDTWTSCIDCIGYPYINGKCMCDVNLMYTGTQCISCPNYKYPLNEQCLCQPGYSDNGLDCVICPSDSVANPNQASCKCNDILKIYDPTSNQCKCIEDYRINEDSCLKCPINTTTKGQIGQNSCTCNDILKDYIIGAENCQCKVNFIIQGESCLSCPSNGNTNGLRNQTLCLCNDPLMSYSIGDNSCKCNINTYISQQSCIQCPENSSTNGQDAQTQCICSDTLFTHDILKLLCVCKENYMIDGSSCTACPTSTSTHGKIGQSICTCENEQPMENGVCQCASGYAMYNGQCTLITDSYLVCSQQLQNIPIFDMTAVTNSLSQSDFSLGYAFSSSNVINNAFIDMKNNIFSSAVSPLFQSQSSFTNLKIQIGTQTLNSGQLLTNENGVIINQMSIISTPGTQLNAGTGSFSILQALINFKLQTMLLSLSFTSSSTGNISLIKSASGILNISQYTISGDYQSTNCISLVGLVVNQAQVIINSVSVSPSTFNSGNYSSFLFSLINQSTLSFASVTVNIGNTSNQLKANQISSSQSTPYNFGGLVTYLNYSSFDLSFVMCFYNSTYATNFILYSGLFVGSASISTTVNIQYVCVIVQINSTVQFQGFGLIGYSDAVINISFSSISHSIQCNYMQIQGVLGHVSLQCPQVTANNLLVSGASLTQSGSYGDSAGLFGWERSLKCTVTNTNISFENKYAQMSMGGIAGFIGNEVATTINIMNVTVQNSVLVASNSVGGLFGFADLCTFVLNQILIKNVRVTAQSYVGIVLGNNPGHGKGPNVFQITNGSGIGNYVNSAIQSDCASMTNTWSVGQC
ncbi:vWA-like_protein [Hexamita inflata]|uniref:VWA-like protein n=1 Tax=Hexamita inflata TaxID=28002 RepID=A0AA86Q781_9EUKA|nr:vWA-like protein [Hexamita inflata]